MWRFERRTFYTGSLRVKLILACQEVQKMSLALKEPYEIGFLFIHFQTLPPSMDYKWKEIIDLISKTTNGKLEWNIKSSNMSRGERSGLTDEACINLQGPHHLAVK